MLPALRGGSDQDGSARPRIQTRCRLVVVAALRVIRSGLPGISLRYSGILIRLVDISAHGEVRLRFRVGDFPAGGRRRSRHAVLALVFGELTETLIDLLGEVIVHFLEIVDGKVAAIVDDGSAIDDAALAHFVVTVITGGALPAAGVTYQLAARPPGAAPPTA